MGGGGAGVGAGGGFAQTTPLGTGLENKRRGGYKGGIWGGALLFLAFPIHHYFGDHALLQGCYNCPQKYIHALII